MGNIFEGLKTKKTKHKEAIIRTLVSPEKSRKYKSFEEKNISKVFSEIWENADEKIKKIFGFKELSEETRRIFRKMILSQEASSCISKRQGSGWYLYVGNAIKEDFLNSAKSLDDKERERIRSEIEGTIKKVKESGKFKNTRSFYDTCCIYKYFEESLETEEERREGLKNEEIEKIERELRRVKEGNITLWELNKPNLSREELEKKINEYSQKKRRREMKRINKKYAKNK